MLESKSYTGNSGFIAATKGPCQAKEPQIEAQLKHQHGSVARLATLNKALLEKLSVIIRPLSDEKAGFPEEALVPLAHEMRSIALEIDMQADLIDAILNHLEL